MTNNTRKHLNRISRRRARRRAKRNRSGMFTILALAFIISTLMCTGATASKIADTETLCVSRGDTLWDIATECNTQGKDVRNIMDDIMKLNNMKTAELHVGDILTVPVY